MMRHTRNLFNLVTIILPVILLTGVLQAAQDPSSPAKVRLQQPSIYFTENRGQWDERVLFKADGGRGSTWWFERDGLTVAVTVPDTTASQAVNPPGLTASESEATPLPARRGWQKGESVNHGGLTPERAPRKGHALKLRFVPSPSQSNDDLVFASGVAAKQSQPVAEIIPSERLSWNNNYFLGNDESKWAPDCGNFSRLTYRNVWEGIDVVYYGEGEQLKYDYVVRPGADPANVRLRWLGLEEPLSVTPSSLTASSSHAARDGGGTELLLATSVGTLREGIPLAYQRGEDGSRIPVEVSFAVLSENEVGLEVVGEWDRTKELVVDPLVYSTFLGGRMTELIKALVPDGVGGVFMAGYTGSETFPTTEGTIDTSFNGGYNDAFIARLSSNGTDLLFCTYLGGELSEGTSSLAPDGEGGVFAAGGTPSADFPVTENAYDQSFNGPNDVFVSRLNADGNVLLYSTFLGGGRGDVANSLIAYGQGSIIVAGSTTSDDFPTSEGAYDRSINGEDYPDVFITQLSGNGGELIFSTLLGGNGHDYAEGLALDGEGGLFIAGYTRSDDFAVTEGVFDSSFNGESDAFVARINGDGSQLIFSTFLGGNIRDNANAIASDGAGGVVVAGDTESDDFPTTERAFDNSHNGNYDAYVARLSRDGSELIYGTFLGGDSFEYANALLADGEGGVIVAGSTKSWTFPVTVGAYDRWLTGAEFDTFIARLNGDGSELLYGTFFGGVSWDQGYAIANDGFGGIVIAGCTSGTDFPISEGAFDRTYNGGETDAFIAKIDGIVLAVDEYPAEQAIPTSCSLLNPFPNPFNSTTTIRFGLPVAGEASLRVTDTNGRLMTTLVEGRLDAGWHETVWDAANIPAGVYLVELNAGERKMLQKVAIAR